MIAFIAARLAPMIGLRAAKLAAWAAVIAVLLVALWFIRHDAYQDGKRDERGAWNAKVAELAAKAEKLQRAADDLRRSAEEVDRARIASNRKEVDDAVKNLPDQGTSARQRARACIELRRQAAAAGKPQPAC